MIERIHYSLSLSYRNFICFRFLTKIVSHLVSYSRRNKSNNWRMVCIYTSWIFVCTNWTFKCFANDTVIKTKLTAKKNSEHQLNKLYTFNFTLIIVHCRLDELRLVSPVGSVKNLLRFRLHFLKNLFRLFLSILLLLLELRKYWAENTAEKRWKEQKFSIIRTLFILPSILF